MLTLLMVMLVGLFTVGCGDSGEDFVVTGNNGQVPTGNVTFQFARAQNVATVPTATQKLLFTFFNAAGQSTGTAGTAFANTVTLAVPVGSTRATVQALGANDAVLATVNFTFTVLQGQTVTAVPTGGGTTGTTGNTTGGTTGNTTGGTTGNTTGGTTGNTTGGTTGNTTGGTTGNTTGGTTGNTTGGTAARLVLFQENLFVTPGGATAALQGLYFPANSTVGVPVGGATLNAFSGSVVSTTGNAANWTFSPGGSNTIQAQGGLPPTNAAVNTEIVFNVTHTPAVGQAASDTVKVTATTDPTLIARIQSAQIATIPGATLKLPVGSMFPLGIVEVDGAGNVTPVAPANIVAAPATGLPGDYIVASSNLGAVTYAAGMLNFAAVGQSTLTFTRNNANNDGPTNVGTRQATVVDLTQFPVPAAGQFNTFLALTGASSGPSGSVLPYKAEIKFADGSVQDITSVAGAAIGGAAGWVLNTSGGLNSGSVTVGTAAGETLALTGAPILGTIPNYTPNTSPVALTRNP